jgi:dUTP pyrophosphatase
LQANHRKTEVRFFALQPYQIPARLIDALIVPVVKIKRLRGDMPRYQSEHAAGIDLEAALDRPLALEPLSRAAIPTGIAVEIPSGFEGQVRARSGRALNEGLAIVNSPGTIDADYRGEVKVIAVNLSPERIMINPGERIAQLVIAPVAHAQLVEVDELETTARGTGGFGHTGKS